MSIVPQDPEDKTNTPRVTPADLDWAAAIMVEKAHHWYYAEREICGRASDTEPPCVKSPGHDGHCDGTYQPSWEERFSEWCDHQRAEGRAEMARDAAEGLE